MKYLLTTLIALTTASAQARMECSATCTLTGPGVKETQQVYYYDGFLAKSFEFFLEGQRIGGAFSVDGDPNTFCGNLKSVWVNIDGQTHLWQDSEVIFNIDSVPHKFSCNYSNGSSNPFF